jgi:hypothetical protein
MKCISFFICILLCLSCRTKRQESIQRGTDPPASSVQSDRPLQLHEDDIGWLSRNASLAFIGQLDRKESSVDEKGMIITNNSFRIEKVLKGAQGSGTLNLTTLGGTSGGQTMDVSHMPVFEPGVKYLLFLAPNPARYAPVLNNDKGVFLIQGEKVFSYSGSIVQNIENGKIIYGSESIARGEKGPGSGRAPGTITGETGVKLERTASTETGFFPLSKFVAQIH